MSNPGKPFVRGMSKVPGSGRAKGSRNKICARFIDDLHAEWEKSGASALAIFAKEDPGGFAKLTASIDDSELAELREAVRRRIDQRRAFIERVGPGTPETIN